MTKLKNWLYGFVAIVDIITGIAGLICIARGIDPGKYLIS